MNHIEDPGYVQKYEILNKSDNHLYGGRLKTRNKSIFWIETNGENPKYSSQIKKKEIHTKTEESESESSSGALSCEAVEHILITMTAMMMMMMMSAAVKLDVCMDGYQLCYFGGIITWKMTMMM